MAEQTDQSKNELLKSLVQSGGVVVFGKVQSKKNWPAKAATGDNSAMPESWTVDVAYMGGHANINVSKSYYDRSSLGDMVIIPVSQRGKNGSIYNTAVES